MRSGRRGRKRHDALVHHPNERNIDDHDENQNRRKQRHHRRQRRNRADNRGNRGDQRVNGHVHQAGVATHEATRLAHERSAKTTGVERHGLIGKRVEAQARQMIIAGDLELVDGIVLQLGENLA